MWITIGLPIGRFCPQGQHWPPPVISTSRCQRIWPTWLTNQNTDWCFVVIGLVGRQSHNPLLQLKIIPLCQMGPPYWSASSRCQRIFINICDQNGIQKNIYIHPWFCRCGWLTHAKQRCQWPLRSRQQMWPWSCCDWLYCLVCVALHCSNWHVTRLIGCDQLTIQWHASTSEWSV